MQGGNVVEYGIGSKDMIQRGGEHMILIVCVDDHNGMMFNHRRQSQDRILRGDILELTGRKNPVDGCL